MAGNAGDLVAGSLIMFWQRRLPHWVPDGSIGFVTWRLAGTLPQPKPALLVNDPHPGRTFVLRDRQLDRAKDGPQCLKKPEIASLFVETLFFGEQIRGSYELFAWVVMPNHVHLVIKPNYELHKIVRWLKASTAVRANRLTSRTGHSFWQREYFDRWIRDAKELASVTAYVEKNPVKAGLCLSPEDWQFSSASQSTGGETASATKPYGG